MNIKEFEKNIRSKVVDGVYTGDIYLSDRQITQLPDLSDITIDGSFYCSYNKLKTLIGSPKRVYHDYYCYNNQLESFVGSPNVIKGSFCFYDNQITSFEGAPNVGGYCIFDKKLWDVIDMESPISLSFILNNRIRLV